MSPAVATPKDLRRSSPAAQEDVRRRVVHAVMMEGVTQVAAARLFGVSRMSVNSWVGRVRKAEADAGADTGPDVLASGKRGRPAGSGAVLKPWQAAKIVNLIRDRMPNQLKLPFYLWTREAVQRLIHDEFGIDLAPTTMGLYLKRWGFTVQKPAVRAYERNEADVLEWLEKKYPAIAERAKKEGALIWWGDETGVRSRHVSGTTFGVKGQTPIVRATGKWFGCNLISAITNRGELAFMLYEGSFNAATFQDFLERLIKQADKKIFLVLDNLRVHHAKVLRPWLAANAEKIELFFLPSYSPDLNPNEILNQDIKTNSVGKERARTKDELKSNTIAHLVKRQSQPEVVASFFGETHVRYAAA